VTASAFSLEGQKLHNAWTIIKNKGKRVGGFSVAFKIFSAAIAALAAIWGLLNELKVSDDSEKRPKLSSAGKVAILISIIALFLNVGSTISDEKIKSDADSKQALQHTKEVDQQKERAIRSEAQVDDLKKELIAQADRHRGELRKASKEIQNNDQLQAVLTRLGQKSEAEKILLDQQTKFLRSERIAAQNNKIETSHHLTTIQSLIEASNRNLNPIQKIEVSCLISIPWDRPELRSFATNFIRQIRPIMLDHNNHDLDEKLGIFDRMELGNKTRKGFEYICIRESSPLFPKDLSTLEGALCFDPIRIRFYKKPVKVSSQGKNRNIIDMTLEHPSADLELITEQEDSTSTKVYLEYHPAYGQLFLVLNSVVASPITFRNSGRIGSLTDLAGAQMVASRDSRLVPDTIPISTLRSVRANSNIVMLKLHINNRDLFFGSKILNSCIDKNGDPRAEFSFPKEDPLLSKYSDMSWLYRDRNGYVNENSKALFPSWLLQPFGSDPPGLPRLDRSVPSSK
jgi:hypothetical protein